MRTNAELSRYARQIVLPEVGLSGQEALGVASVLVIGAGGLGSPAALYLAAAGIGHIGLIDDDVVELSNLHRQILHGTADVGRSKAESGRDALRRLDDRIRVEAHQVRITSDNAAALLQPYDVVIDGSDNYPTRYVINDTCATLQKPWVYGSVERFAGQVSVFGAPGGPCYRCLFPEPPSPGSSPSCEEIGVLGAVPGVVGALQAIEALKLLLRIGDPLVGRLVQVDLLTMSSHVISFDRVPECPACGAPRREPDRANDAAELPVEVAPAELAERLRAKEGVLLLDVREGWEVQVSRIASARHVPMNELPGALDTLERARETIVYCHHGTRSAMVVHWLRQQGYRARNLTGGIDRWSREVDPGVPRY